MSSSTPAKRKLRGNDLEIDIKFIGTIAFQITGSKLPSKRQVLQVMFYHMRYAKLSKRESARLVVREAMIFWEKARIPTQFIEESLGRELTYFACRHHVYEIVLRQAFETKFGKTEGPNVSLFEKFKKDWREIDHTKFKSGIADKEVQRKIGTHVRQKITQFCLQQLQNSHYRDDYKEFLELVVLFLGGSLPNVKVLRRPGPTCHARWMAKAINSLKMFHSYFENKSRLSQAIWIN